MARYVLDPGARRLDAGLVLLAGSPLRLFRLTRGGALLLDRVERGDDVPATKVAARLIDRLLDAGAIHPLPDQRPRWATGDVSVVIPSYGEAVDALVAHLGDVAKVVVVDDGSSPPLHAPAGAVLVRRSRNGGPGAARNSGLAEVDTPLVAFVDADTEPAADWLAPLLGHFDDPQVGLVAPRVVGDGRATDERTDGRATDERTDGRATDERTDGRASDGRSDDRALRDRYEAIRSPLDLGPASARVRARTRVSYVPAAAIVCRAEAVRALEGFDASLRVGEDVDLVWRLDEAGWRCRYEPASVVRHRPRPTWLAWARQRFAYGRSAAGLARRHRGALTPVAMSGWSAAAWGLLVAGAPIAALAVLGGTSIALARKLKPLRHPLPTATRLAGGGTLLAGRQLATAATRAWWPITLAGSLASRRVRRAVVVAAIVPAMLDWWRERPAMDPVRYGLVRLADDVSYGAGLWAGAIAEGTAAPLLPDWTSWPRPGRYERRAPPSLAR
jgi:GT2 family glycosyltransferase